MCLPGCVETAYIFPGIGLGTIVSRATRLRDETFLVAAEALADFVTDGGLHVPHQGTAVHSVKIYTSTCAQLRFCVNI